MKGFEDEETIRKPGKTGDGKRRRPYAEQDDYIRLLNLPEQRLIGAMLQRVVLDLKVKAINFDFTNEYVEVVKDDAISWVLYEGEEPWSFRWCCFIVGLDPEYFIFWLVQKGLLQIAVSSDSSA